MLNISRALLCAVALTLFVVPVFGQGTPIEPCPATPAPATHLGYQQNGREGDSFVAAQVDGIDFIASGIYVGRVDFTFRSGKLTVASGRLLDLRNA